RRPFVREPLFLAQQQDPPVEALRSEGVRSGRAGQPAPYDHERSPSTRHGVLPFVRCTAGTPGECTDASRPQARPALTVACATLVPCRSLRTSRTTAGPSSDARRGGPAVPSIPIHRS